MKELELQFHTADYHLLTEVALGLRNATEHLSKVGHAQAFLPSRFNQNWTVGSLGMGLVIEYVLLLSALATKNLLYHRD